MNNLDLEEGVVALSYVAIDNSNRISNSQGILDKKAGLFSSVCIVISYFVLSIRFIAWGLPTSVLLEILEN